MHRIRILQGPGLPGQHRYRICRNPHPLHFGCCMLALIMAKPSCAKSSMTINAVQAELIYEKAREKGLVWRWRMSGLASCRSASLSGTTSQEESRGDVIRSSSRPVLRRDPRVLAPADHRSVNRELAGGCLLDLGVYESSLDIPMPASPSAWGSQAG